VEKGEIACHEQFLLFPSVFKRLVLQTLKKLMVECRDQSVSSLYRLVKTLQVVLRPNLLLKTQWQKNSYFFKPPVIHSSSTMFSKQFSSSAKIVIWERKPIGQIIMIQMKTVDLY
jgi:hypothetical protein